MIHLYIIYLTYYHIRVETWKKNLKKKREKRLKG